MKKIGRCDRNCFEGFRLIRLAGAGLCIRTGFREAAFYRNQTQISGVGSRTMKAMHPSHLRFFSGLKHQASMAGRAHQTGNLSGAISATKVTVISRLTRPGLL